MHLPLRWSKIKEKLCRKGRKMNREQERAKRRLEKNPVVECNKIQNKYYPWIEWGRTLFRENKETKYILNVF